MTADRMPWHPEGVGFVDLGVTEIGADTVSCQPETRITWGRAHPDDPFTPAPGTLTFRLRADVSNFVARVPVVAYWPKDGQLHARFVRIQKESRGYYARVLKRLIPGKFETRSKGQR